MVDSTRVVCAKASMARFAEQPRARLRGLVQPKEDIALNSEYSALADLSPS